jgi:hypothetical protein
MEAKRMSKELSEQEARKYLEGIVIRRQMNTWQVKVLTVLFGFMMWMFIFILFALLLAGSFKAGTWLLRILGL